MKSFEMPDWVKRFLEITVINIVASILPAAFVLMTPDVIAAKSLFLVSIVDIIVMMVANVIFARKHFFFVKQNARKYLRVNVSAFLIYTAISAAVYLFLYGADNVNFLVWLLFPAGIFSYFGVIRTVALTMYLAPLLVAIVFAPAYNYKFISKRFNDR